MKHTTILLALFLIPQLGFAEGREPSPTERELIMAVSRVSANEGALQNLRETALIWQATESHGTTPAKRLKWLRAHSARVLGDRPCLQGNCNWVKTLKANDAAPQGFNKQWWMAARATQWKNIRTLAKQLVLGEVVDRPCVETPSTWGSHLLDSENVKREHMRWLNCSEDLLNDGAK